MNQETIETALRALSVQAQTPADHRLLAERLQEAAARHVALAAARERQRARLPEQRVRSGTAKGGRPSTPWVQLISSPRARSQADQLHLRLSTSLYYAAGSPARLDVQRWGGELRLHPVSGAQQGYAVTVNTGGIRMNVSGLRDMIRLAPGKYHAVYQAGVINIGAPMESHHE